MPLKAMCHSLVSNPHHLDTIAVMVGVDRLINPVCQLLSAWPQDADHSKHLLPYHLTASDHVQANLMLCMTSLALVSCLSWLV